MKAKPNYRGGIKPKHNLNSLIKEMIDSDLLLAKKETNF